MELKEKTQLLIVVSTGILIACLIISLGCCLQGIDPNPNLNALIFLSYTMGIYGMGGYSMLQNEQESIAEKVAQILEERKTEDG